MNKPTDKDLIDWAVKNKRVDILVEHKWGYILSLGQTEIVRKIAFLEKKKLSISAMTRYGKTQCVAFGIALLLDFDVPVKVAFLGPKEEQAGIIRQYLSELIVMDKSLLSKAQLFATGAERLGKEASKKRMTFTTGAEYRVFSAEGEADRLMGFGCVSPNSILISDRGVMTAEELMHKRGRIKILSYSHKQSKVEFKKVIHCIENPSKNMIEIESESGCLLCTENHPVYVCGQGYIQAKEVCVNDRLLKCDCFPEHHGSNKMFLLRKPDNSETKPYKKNKDSVLQSQVQRRVAKRGKQSLMGWWKESPSLSELWQNLSSLQRAKQAPKVLLYEMQRHSKKEKTKAKGQSCLSFLWERVQNNPCKEGFKVLLQGMCQQRPCGKDDERKESCLVRGDRESPLASRIRQKPENQNQRQRSSSMFPMWKKRVSSGSSYKLRQEEQQRRESSNPVCELSLQNKLQKGNVAEVIVRRVTKKPKGKVTYNFEVEDHHNYFVNGILTHNCDILVKDEACLINRAAFTKASRMLGDNPESAVEIELYNPWDTDNKAYEHTLDPEWEVIQIGWKQAIKEGRTTQKFVDQQRRDLLPLEFTVLYESKFPEQSEDSIISMAWVNQAELTHFNFLDTQVKLRKKIFECKKKRRGMGESEFLMMMKPLQEELHKYTNIVACDPAEQGLDETVIMWGIEYENNYQIVGSYSEPKSEPMRVVGKIVDIATSFIPKDVHGKVNIDRIGIGSGPLSRLKEVLHTEMQLKTIRVLGCHYGESAMKKDIFHNKKAENWFRLAALLRDGMIDIPEQHKIRKQLISEKTERTSSNKKIVIDPKEKSPDWGDALVYLVWQDKSGLAFGFV